MRVLAGDIGGTKVDIGLFDVSPVAPGESPRPQAIRTHNFQSAEHEGLSSIVATFLEAEPETVGAPVQAACFGVAGPVIDNRTTTSNLPWTLDGAALGRHFGIPRFELINDLVATGLGISALGVDELEPLQEGQASDKGPRALIAAGTGLGMALLVPQNGRLRPLPSEGGHVDLTPRSELDVELWRFLRERHGGHVSIERVVSGPGLHTLYEFLLHREPGSADAAIREAIAADPPNAPQVISEAGLDRRCSLCEGALSLFVRFFGIAAANLALTLLATGGLYIGGGIAPKILPKLHDGSFVAAFRDTGRFGGLLEQIPVRVVLNRRTALLGASLRAQQLAAMA